MGIIARIRNWNQGRKWVVLYRGTDEQEFRQHVDRLVRDGIPCHKEIYDATTKLASAGMIGNVGGAKIYGGRGGSVPGAVAAAATRGLQEAPTDYRILVRQCDLQRASGR